MENIDKNRYLEMFQRNMQEIKMRTKAIESIHKKQNTTLYNETNAEFCALQLRKIIEIIILSSLISNSTEYKKYIIG